MPSAPPRQIGNNPIHVEYTVGVCTREEEFAALECFGPRARHAILNAPLPVLAFTTLEALMKEYEKLKEKHPNIPPLDLKRSDVDSGIAKGIIHTNAHSLMQDREPGDARTEEERIADARLGLKPLIPKRVIRSIR